LKIADILPSKTVPEVNKKKKQTRARKPTTMTAVVPLTKRARVISDKVEERVEDEDGAHNITPTSSFQISDLVQKASHVLHCRHFCLIGVFRKVLAAVVVADTIKEAPIYLFYEIVANGPDGTPGDDGDIHYCCLHHAHKVCTIKKIDEKQFKWCAFPFLLMTRSPTNSMFFSVLVNNLCVHVKPMYSDSKNCPNVWHFLIVCGIASYADQTEPKCWCMRESIT
jgi:hypothetical protein